MRDAADAIDPVEEVSVTRADDSLTCEVVVGLPTLSTTIAEHGGRVVDVIVEHGRATLTAVCPNEENVRSLIDAIREPYPDVGVRSVRSSDTREVTADDLVGSLTDRQHRVLELAYHSGYFERPREHNTTEVASKLGVSRQTLTQHLRAGERKLLAGLLDPADDTASE